MCNEYEELISKALDHELSPEEEKELVAHLALCESCKKEFQQLTNIKKAMADIQQEKLPDNFHDELMKKINSEKVINNKKSINPLFLKLCGLAAVCVLFFGTVVYKSFQNQNMSDMSIETKMAENNSDTMLQQDSFMEEQENSYSGQPYEWTVEVSDAEDFKLKITGYLTENKINYTVSTDEIIVDAQGKSDEIYEWCINNEIQVTKISGSTDSDRLIVKILADTQ